MFVIIGADWCPGCKKIRERLTKLNLPHKYVRMPPGEQGWSAVESITGRRAVPAVLKLFSSPKELHELLDELDLPERELTEDEFDEIFD